ncbi:MAG: CHASE3 domain-containing protein, partial [Verrucomicrobia bacterium]|nr:CHASE3 domain-containing protein [Verrucomicrobiota bacterium]
MKLSTETKVYAFFFAAFAGVVILGFVTYRSTRELIVNDRLVVHTDQVRQSIADLLGAVLEAENRRRDYLLTADARFLEQFLANLDRIPTVTRKIIDLTADNPDQQTRIAELK